jgi:hypothetical protein
MRKFAYSLSFLAIFTIIIVGYCYAENDSKFKLSPTKDPEAPYGVYIPKDIKDAFVELNRMLSPELIEEMKSGTEHEMIR